MWCKTSPPTWNCNFFFWKCYHWWNGFLCKNGPNPFLLSEKMFQNFHKIHVFCVKKLIFFPLWDRLLHISWKKWRKFLPNPLGTVIFLNWKNMKKITIGIRRKKWFVTKWRICDEMTRIQVIITTVSLLWDKIRQLL